MTNHSYRTIYKKVCKYCKEPYYTLNEGSKGHWECYSEHRTLVPSKKAYIVLEFLNGLEDYITCNAISDYLNIRRGNTWKILTKLEGLELIKKKGSGYKITTKGSKALTLKNK